MSRIKPHPFTSIVLVFSTLLVGSACLLISSQAVSTLSVEDVLATMTLMVWTPTTPPTLTPLASSTPESSPTPTATLLPSLTSTPSYDWCKGLDTRRAKEEDINVGPTTGDKGYAAFGCLLEVIGPLYADYPETALLVKVGFNDKTGGLHEYQAVVGGLIYTKPRPQDFQVPACYSKKPKMLTLAEFQDSLKPYLGLGGQAKAFPMFVYTELGYKSHSPSEASLVNRYAEINQRLRAAVETGNDFPDIPERFRLYILPGLEDCQ